MRTKDKNNKNIINLEFKPIGSAGNFPISFPIKGSKVIGKDKFSYEIYAINGRTDIYKKCNNDLVINRDIIKLIHNYKITEEDINNIIHYNKLNINNVLHFILNKLEREDINIIFTK